MEIEVVDLLTEIQEKAPYDTFKNVIIRHTSK